MRDQRRLVVSALVALAATFVALVALAAGGVRSFGTASAGERQTFYAAAVVAIVAAVVLLLQESPAPASRALSGFIAAVALALPAVYAFTYSLTTPADDASGCGTLTTPATQFDQLQRDTVITPTCAARLRQQKVLVAGLAAPSALVLAFAVVGGLRRQRPVGGLQAPVATEQR